MDAAQSDTSFRLGSAGVLSGSVIRTSCRHRSNGQPTGSFLQKAGAPAAVPNTQQTRARRSITNQDLEVYRKARVDSELAYEKERKELGLPSAEERRREAAEIQDRTLDQVRSMRAQEEAYWRSRAEALRAEFERSQPQLLAWLQRQVPAMYSKAYRFNGEMEEIADYVGEDVSAEEMFDAFADFYTRLAADYEGAQAEVGALTAFLKPKQ